MAEVKQIVIPDIGGASEVDVIEVLVAVGDEIQAEDALITLESEKASMEVPSPHAGKVKEINLNVGDKASEGDLILSLEVADDKKASSSSSPAAQEVNAAEQVEAVQEQKTTPEQTSAEQDKQASTAVQDTGASSAELSSDAQYAGPAVRRLARELDIDLATVAGTGHKGRITRQDLQTTIKQRMQGSGGVSAPAMPEIDFSQFGEITSQPLSKIQKFSGKNLQRNWQVIPHVTQFDEADITELEQFRKAKKALAEQRGVKLTPLVFIMKAVVKTLQQYPKFNASLDARGENLILKNYFHLGVAVDTPNGLVVPVIRNVDQKGLLALAEELGAISEKARTKGLSIQEMQGSCFTISSLGGIGGTAFTPIINAPDVAILGVSRSSVKPVHENGQFVPRLMLPLSLSYDHRVIDGADGARFMRDLVQNLSDIRQLLL